ncbi:MAG: hypothetical protein WDZ46_09760 [Solirubrobacterales bacterium]
MRRAEPIGGRRARRALACAGAALCVALAGAVPAGAAYPDPDFVFTPRHVDLDAGSLLPFEGPCGVGIGPDVNRLYVADYYHNVVDVFNDPAAKFEEPGRYQTQVRNVDPLDGPCGLAIGAEGVIFVNSYHRSVLRYTPSSFPPDRETTYSPSTTLDTDTPTGVAAHAPTGRVYVDNRSYVSVYESSGAPALDGEGAPLRIGLGSLGDGYGVAISEAPGTAGRIYVPDAADGTVKVYDPSVDADDPVAAIDGGETPRGAFSSLRDSAVAVDRASGNVYVLDNLQPAYTEQPQGAVHVFDAAGAYKGRLLHNVIHGGPSGLAVDNSIAASQGGVYVTSGNTVDGVVYGYPPGSATEQEKPPLEAAGLELPPAPAAQAAPAEPAPQGASGSQVTASASATSLPVAQPSPTARASELVQRGILRVALTGKLSPRSLPRNRPAPVAISVGGKVSTTDGSQTPQLRRMRIEFNRHGRISHAGLPTCPYRKIQPASTARALKACRAALVGTGRFFADIALAGQEPYPTQGRLLVFNGKRRGKHVLWGQIYAARPFATSFVIVFEMNRRRRGTFGTVITANLPKALGSWGRITGIEMQLKRRYRHRGARRSFLSSACPAPKGFRVVPFPLARATFEFAGGRQLRETLVRTCRVRG